MGREDQSAKSNRHTDRHTDRQTNNPKSRQQDNTDKPTSKDIYKHKFCKTEQAERGATRKHKAQTHQQTHITYQRNHKIALRILTKPNKDIKQA